MNRKIFFKGKYTSVSSYLSNSGSKQFLCFWEYCVKIVVDRTVVFGLQGFLSTVFRMGYTEYNKFT